MHQKKLRHSLLNSAAEKLLPADDLLSCFPQAETAKAHDRASCGTDTTAPCTEQALESWFDPLDISMDSQEKTLVVRFPHPFFGVRFAALYQSLFERKARALWGESLRIVYLNPQNTPCRGTRQDSNAGEAKKDCGLHPALGNPAPYGEEWTFDTFIANGKHKWALSLARETTRRTVAKRTHQPDRDAEVPGLLVLCGPHGTGKTHLLRAIANELFRTLGDDILYSSLTDMELLFASRPTREVRQDLALKDAVLIDDFQYISRLSDTAPSRSRSGLPSGLALRDELALLIDRFAEQGKPVIIAGVGRPKDWGLGKALLSRLETGLWAELPEPDLDVRMRYAQQQAKLRRLILPKDQLLLLAQHCPDIRRLSGVILRAASHRSLLGRDLSEQDLLNIVRQSGDSSALTPQLIVSIVGEHCGVPAKEILGEKRRPDLVQARQLAMYLCRELLGHSYPVIGRMFGGKDHSTVMHGVKKIKLLQEHDRLTHTLVTELTKACLERRG